MMMTKVSPLMRTRWTLSNNRKALFMMSSDNKKNGTDNTTEDKNRTNANAPETDFSLNEAGKAHLNKVDGQNIRNDKIKTIKQNGSAQHEIDNQLSI